MRVGAQFNQLISHIDEMESVIGKIEGELTAQEGSVRRLVEERRKQGEREI